MRVFVPFFLVACQSTPEAPSAAPPALQQAHEAWVNGDLAELTSGVRDVLASSPPAHVEANALALLEVAFERQPSLPSDQRLPAGVRSLSLNHVHRVGPDGHRFRLVMTAHADDTETIEAMSLSGPGVSSVGQALVASAEPNQAYVELELPDGPLPAAAGLYDLTVRVGGEDHHLWAALTQHTASEVPLVASPYPGQIVDTPHPTVRFTPESTPEHLAGEGVGYGLWLASRPDYREVWSQGGEDHDGHAMVDVALPDGKYWLAVSRRETRSLGPVKMGRVARRGIPFQVRTR